MNCVWMDRDDEPLESLRHLEVRAAALAERSRQTFLGCVEHHQRIRAALVLQGRCESARLAAEEAITFSREHQQWLAQTRAEARLLRELSRTARLAGA